MMGPYLPYDNIKGVESQMGVNHLSHLSVFLVYSLLPRPRVVCNSLFTKLILPKIQESKQKPRIVNVSSAAHYAGQIDFDDMNYVSLLVLKLHDRSMLCNREMARHTTKRELTANPRLQISISQESLSIKAFGLFLYTLVSLP